MARINYIHPVDTLSGKFSKSEHNGAIMRRKQYRDENGNVYAVGVNEAYVVRHPRNYKKNPLTQGEQRTVNAFREGMLQYQVEKQDPERMAYWRARFNAQLKKGDPEAPIDPKTGLPRIYTRLDTFIRTMLQLRFRNNSVH